MRYRLEIDEDSAPGLITVSSSSNGRTMAALDFRVLEPGSPPLVRGTAVSLTGSKLRQGRKTTWEGTFANYFQYSGVRPGRNVLTFGVSQQEGARLKSLRVFPDSGILVTRNGPSAVELTPSLSDRDIRVGESFRLKFSVRSVGEAAVPAGGKVAISAGPLRVIGPRSIKLGRIPLGRAETGVFKLVGERAGNSPITQRVTTSGGTAEVRLAARVTEVGEVTSGEPPGSDGEASGQSSDVGSSSSASVWLVVAALALALLVAVALVALVRRRSTSSR